MLSLAAMFAVRYWKPLAMAAAVAAAIAWRGVLVAERDHARADAARAVAEAAALRSSNAALTAALAQQNAAVTAVRAHADAQARALDARAAAASRAGAAVASRARAQAHRLASAPIGAGCEAAIRWGNERAAELSRW